MFNSEALKDIIEGGGVPYRFNGVSWIFRCPRCSKKAKLYIHKEGFFCCFRCREIDNFKGRCEYALAEIYGVPSKTFTDKLYPQQHYQLTNFISLDLKDFFGYEEPEESWAEEEFSAIELDPNFVDYRHEAFLKYGAPYLVNKRGLRTDQIKKYDLMYNPAKQCVVFPVKIDGKIIGWQQRHISKNIKLTNTGLDKSKVLMFQDNLDNIDHCVLAEGPISALHCELIGGNVASMGKDVSNAQINIIKNKVKKLYLALDPDAAKVVDRICRQVYGELEVYTIFPIGGYDDVGAMPFDLVYEEYQKAKPAFGKFYMYLKTPQELVF